MSSGYKLNIWVENSQSVTSSHDCRHSKPVYQHDSSDGEQLTLAAHRRGILRFSSWTFRIMVVRHLWPAILIPGTNSPVILIAIIRHMVYMDSNPRIDQGERYDLFWERWPMNFFISSTIAMTHSKKPGSMKVWRAWHVLFAGMVTAKATSPPLPMPRTPA